MINWIKVHWIKILLFTFIFIFLYSHITSFIISKEINKTLNEHSFIQYSYEDYIDYFKTNHYQYGVIDDRNLYAHIEGGRVEIGEYQEGQFRIYQFENTKDDISPFIKGISWEDTLKDVKRKLNINFFNTRFHSLIRLNTLVSYNQDTIVISKGNDSNYQMMFCFKENQLYRIVVYYWFPQ